MTAPRESAGVSVRGLSKRYGAIEAVREVSFEVAPGEIFGLLGPNGAGKTTILECILGLRSPDLGTIRIDGIDALADPKGMRRIIGAQIQAATLQDTVTPREALRLFASFYRDAARPGDLLRQFGLEEKADSRFGTLSAGQRQRLFLALAFVSQPRVVVLDEPTAGLDPKARRELHQLITKQRDAGRTILLSTHDLEEADKLCDRIAIVDCGRIVVVDRPAHLIADSGLAARLLFQTARPLAARQVGALAGVVTCESHGTGWKVGTNDLSATVQALTRLVGTENNALLDLQTHQPSLEEVYLELTGHAWPGNQDGGTGQ